MLFVAVLLPILFLSCSGGQEGYGVILLSPNSQAVKTGEMVTIEESSSIDETYTISLPDRDEKVEIEMWRIKFFEEKKKARSYAESYEQYIPIFAENARDGLAIREKPDATSQRVYKMRGGQTIKVLNREDEKSTVGSYEGYWYRVLTKDGVSGYCFDQYLDVYNTRTETKEEDKPDLSKIREVLSRTYRPVDFERMMENETIKLEKFSSRYGFFSNPEEKTFTIRTFDYSHTFEYEEIKKQSERSYIFSGAEVELRIDDEKHITLIYTKEDNNYAPGFVLIDNLSEIRKKEKERRSKLLSALVEAGPSFSSSAYGTLTFEKEGSFEWSRFERLVPRIIPSKDLSGGELRFDRFVGSEVGPSYSGVLSFLFEGLGEKELVFLYTLEGDKLTLEYVSPKNRANKVVLKRNASPLIMVFFSES